MKITIYELLGLIKDGKAPEKIKYNDIVLEYEEETKDYHEYYGKGLFEYKFATCNDFLNDEVEILEETNKIDNSMPKHLSNEFIQQIDKCITHQDIKCIAHKVNEVINYLQHISK